MIRQRAWHGHVRLHVSEPSLLQRPVWRDVEGVRLAKKSLQLKGFEVNVDAASHAFRADAPVPVLRIDHMQMHVCSLAEHDLVAHRNAEPISSLPEGRTR